MLNAGSFYSLKHQNLIRLKSDLIELGIIFFITVVGILWAEKMFNRVGIIIKI